MHVILDELEKTLYFPITTEGYYDRTTGEYIPGTTTYQTFRGAVLPLSEKDLKFLEDGAYTLDYKKLYTDKTLKNNQIIKDGSIEYKVVAERDYDIINVDFKRYFIKRVGDISG